MNLDIDRVIDLIFSTLNVTFCIGWDKMEFWCIFATPLWISPQVNLTI